MRLINWFRQRFVNTEQKMKEATESFYDIESSKKNSWILYEHDLFSQNYPFYRCSGESRLYLGEIISHLYNIKKEELFQLTINNNGQLTTITDPNLIWRCDIIAPYKPEQMFRQDPKTFLFHKKEEQNDDKSDSPHYVFYTLMFRNESKKNEYSDKSDFFSNGTLMLQSVNAGKYNNDTFYLDISSFRPEQISCKGHKSNESKERNIYHNFSVAYDYKNSSQSKNEYEFVREAIMNYDSKAASFIKKHEWQLLLSVNHDLSREYYWGKKAFSQQRFLDSILYFENIYDILKKKWFKSGLESKEMLLLTESAFLIGCSFNELKEYERAYHYLELACRTSFKSCKYKKEFIKCLIKSKDILSIIYLDDSLKEMKNIPENERNSDENDFFYFLLRSKAYILVQMDQLDDAEYILLRLLEKDPNNEEVIRDLAFIQGKKKKESATYK